MTRSTPRCGADKYISIDDCLFNEENKVLADYLKTKREATKLSQKQVSEALGYSSAQFISNWERGESTPPIHTIKKLSKLYKFDLADFKALYLRSEIARLTQDIENRFAKA